MTMFRFVAMELYCALGSGVASEFSKKKSTTYAGVAASVKPGLEGLRVMVAPLPSREPVR